MLVWWDGRGSDGRFGTRVGTGQTVSEMIWMLKLVIVYVPLYVNRVL